MTRILFYYHLSLMFLFALMLTDLFESSYERKISTKIMVLEAYDSFNIFRAGKF